ncbi:hypothetical protein [Alkalihalobacterium chitinilyticum]|uniref:ABC transporter ATPase n=1 Tax=Alkalihalobacterium chitinilyticum TaxID=2980103 RepID=A0ABT5VJ74_9BACI|nr:hypothetical protein [Alkalihalobacterium chitinilyticum]MDE5415231.1 hypothetical protein [Alkalihalobacterium chitinilyticum]
MILKKFNEQDYLVLRIPFETNRQSPSSLGRVFVLCIFCQALLLFLEFYVAGYSVFPHIDQIVWLHLVLSVLLTVVSIFFSVPKIYNKYQKSQYLISILISHNLFTISTFILLFACLGTMVTSNNDAIQLQVLATVMLWLGLLVFLVTCIRFYILLKKGHYRKGSANDRLRSKFDTKSYLPTVIIISLGFFYIMQFLFRQVDIAQMDLLFIIVILILIFYVMLFVLPEQLVILYCKYRFKSFIFESNGKYLISVQDTQEVEKSSFNK